LLLQRDRQWPYVGGIRAERAGPFRDPPKIDVVSAGQTGALENRPIAFASVLQHSKEFDHRPGAVRELRARRISHDMTDV
jgi:hypothetical protein